MNNTIDFNTAKTIDTMSKKIDHIDDTVSGFFSFMHMVMQNELGNRFKITEMFLSAGQRSTSRLSRFDSDQHPLSRFPSRSVKKGL